MPRPPNSSHNSTACNQPTHNPTTHNQDFNFLLQVAGAPTPARATPRLAAAAACAALPSCDARAPAAAICPNAFRDCATGKLVQADPAQRCAGWSVCPEVKLAGGKATGGAGSGRAGVAAAVAAAGALLLVLV
jgi:hypothetical protein